MSKKRSIWKFSILAILVALGLVLTFASFNVAGTVYHYNGFVNSIPLGLDLSGGTAVTYDASLSNVSVTDDLDSAVLSTISGLNSMLYNYGLSDAIIEKQDSDKIRIEISNQENDFTDLFELIGEPVSLYLSSNQNFDIKNPTGDYLSSKDISNVYVSTSSDGSSYGVAVEFKSSVKEKFTKLSNQASNSSTIYAYVGEESAISLSSDNFIDDTTTAFISGGSITTSSSSAEYFIRITSGSYSADLSLSQISVVSASLGKDSLLLSAIALGVVAFLVMLLLLIRYRELGLLACFSLVIFTVLFAFFLMAVPFVKMSLPGLAGVLIAFAMATIGNIIIFERIRSEYASGRKIPLSTKNGFKKSLWPILDIHIVTVISSILLYILGTVAIKEFGMILLIGSIISAFCSLVVTRLLVKWYLPLNSTNAKRMNLIRSKALSDETTSEAFLEEGGEKWHRKNLRNQDFL